MTTEYRTGMKICICDDTGHHRLSGCRHAGAVKSDAGRERDPDTRENIT